MMTRNDFETLARHLKAMYPEIDGTEDQSDIDYRDGYNAAINQVAGACSAVNARFDVAIFKAAVGATDVDYVHTKIRARQEMRARDDALPATLPKMPAKGKPISW